MTERRKITGMIVITMMWVVTAVASFVNIIIGLICMGCAPVSARDTLIGIMFIGAAILAHVAISFITKDISNKCEMQYKTSIIFGNTVSIAMIVSLICIL